MEAAARIPTQTSTGGTHYVTLRLVDALPRSAMEAWHDEIDRSTERLRTARRRPLDATDEREILLRSLGRIDRQLDAGRGNCYLSTPATAETVRTVLMNGHGNRYRLNAWCVMPNHVHAIVSPCGDTSIADVLRDWKSESTRAIDGELNRAGTVWHADVIQYAVRHPLEMDRLRQSILTNPSHARLENWPYVGSEQEAAV